MLRRLHRFSCTTLSLSLSPLRFFFFIQTVSCDGRTGVSDLKAALCFVPSFPFLVMSTLEICGPIFPDLKVSDCLHDSGAIFCPASSCRRFKKIYTGVVRVIGR
jgi:hypothetical protein